MGMKRDTAKIFRTGRSQAVRIPKAYRFDCEEVFIERDGDRVILTPRKRPRSWKEYFSRPSRLPADFPDRIDDLPPEPIKGL
ncbi:MAG: antitoxin [Candidatus Binataceae bacterium]